MNNTAEAILAEINLLSTEEVADLLSNLQYVNTVLFQQPDFRKPGNSLGYIILKYAGAGDNELLITDDLGNPRPSFDYIDQLTDEIAPTGEQIGGGYPVSILLRNFSPIIKKTKDPPLISLIN